MGDDCGNNTTRKKLTNQDIVMRLLQNTKSRLSISIRRAEDLDSIRRTAQHPRGSPAVFCWKQGSAVMIWISVTAVLCSLAFVP